VASAFAELWLESPASRSGPFAAHFPVSAASPDRQRLFAHEVFPSTIDCAWMTVEVLPFTPGAQAKRAQVVAIYD
jgi:hypothetical protein